MSYRAWNVHWLMRFLRDSASTPGFIVAELASLLTIQMSLKNVQLPEATFIYVPQAFAALLLRTWLGGGNSGLKFLWTRGLTMLTPVDTTWVLIGSKFSTSSLIRLELLAAGDLLSSPWILILPSWVCTVAPLLQMRINILHMGTSIKPD